MTIKVGAIGAGKIAQMAHLPSYNKIREVELVGIADVNEVAAKNMAEKYNCKSYTDFRQLIDANELDALSICTPPFARKEIIQYAAENGVNILCEKPIANSYTEALEIKNIAEKYDIQFMMGFTLRFFNRFQDTLKIIREGKLGDVICARIVYSSSLPSELWFFDREKSGGGAIIDKGAHVIDLVTWFFGVPEKVYATILNKRNMDVEENAFITLTHCDTTSQLAVLYGANKQMDRFEFWGTACNLIIDRELIENFFFLPASKYILKDYLLHFPKRALKVYLERKNVIKKEDPYFKEISYFIDCLRKGEEVSPNYIDGFNNIRIIDACYESIDKKKVSQLKEE